MLGVAGNVFVRGSAWGPSNSRAAPTVMCFEMSPTDNSLQVCDRTRPHYLQTLARFTFPTGDSSLGPPPLMDVLMLWYDRLEPRARLLRPPPPPPPPAAACDASANSDPLAPPRLLARAASLTFSLCADRTLGSPPLPRSRPTLRGDGGACFVPRLGSLHKHTHGVGCHERPPPAPPHPTYDKCSGSLRRRLRRLLPLWRVRSADSLLGYR